MTDKGLIAIAASIAIFAGFASALGQGMAVTKAVEAVGKNPEANDKIRLMMIMGCGITETNAVYGLLISFILLFFY
jgi:F0F1-type ATP synthase, subunit c/Archaeal/vacuolar-type H+-ATPase, subunit K